MYILLYRISSATSNLFVYRAYEKEFIENWQQFDAAHEKFLAAPVGADSNSLITFREQIDLSKRSRSGLIFLSL